MFYRFIIFRSFLSNLRKQVSKLMSLQKLEQINKVTQSRKDQEKRQTDLCKNSFNAQYLLI